MIHAASTRPKQLDRTTIADLIVPRLASDAERLASEFRQPGRVPTCALDELLPDGVARAIWTRFPPDDRMMLRRSIRESKHVAAQMNHHDPLIEEAVYAFQDPRVVELVAAITGLPAMEPDSDLYAGGISAMGRGAYLRPHLDNSHDGTRSRYRALNLLYYVTPDWSSDQGGSLELWDQGPEGTPRSIESRFNRLVLMATNRNSWHSVNEVRSSGRRCCVSNYYFTRQSPESEAYFHATSFRAEYGRGLGDAVMRVDNRLRTSILKWLPDVYQNPHVYRKDG